MLTPVFRDKNKRNFDIEFSDDEITRDCLTDDMTMTDDDIRMSLANIKEEDIRQSA